MKLEKSFKKGLFALLVLGLLLGACVAPPGPDPDSNSGDMGSHIVKKEQLDDWKYSYESGGSGSSLLKKAANAVSGGMRMEAMSASAPTAMSDSLGFSTGGAKDVDNFRENIKNDYLPLPTDITYEGLFYDYYFDTGRQDTCHELFCPSYSFAVSDDPFSGEEEYWMTVGLNSNLKESDFERKPLNLVVVLDISGSMSSSFNRYYYDRTSNRQVEYEDYDDSRKIEVARESIVDLMDHLEDDDRLSIVLFDNNGFLAKPFRLVEETDMDAIEEHILDLEPRGGTNFAAGYEVATDQFDDLSRSEKDMSERENRIIFLTDAMPNIGELSKDGLFGMTKTNAKEDIHTTFIGIGVDFNSELIEEITKVRGANYFSVHKAKDFETRMDDEFELMVTPLVFELELELEADGYRIEKVFGSPEADEATGEIMKVNTLFPSRTSDGETRGGVVLLKLERLRDNADLELSVKYENRAGEEFSSSKDVSFANEEAEFFEHDGIRKAVLLSRYASLVQEWIIEEREGKDDSPRWMPDSIHYEGIIIPEERDVEPYRQRSPWERSSLPLVVSSDYEDLFEDFADYFSSEMDAIGDDELEQELDIIELLAEN